MRIIYTFAAALVVLTSPAMAVADPVKVPDGGLTVAMLSMAVGGLVLLRRKAR